MTIAIGCDLGGTHLSMAVVRDRSLLAVKDIPIESRDGLAAVLPLLHSTALSLLDACSLRLPDCLGLALTVPSLVDFKHARIASTNNKYPDATSLDLHGWCNKHLGLPLAIENDARAALRGEHFCGAAEGFSDVLMLTIGTGIGSAVFVDGKPYQTRHLQGGNLGGHIPVSLHGRKCTCGAIGCMEAEASSWSLPAIVAGWAGAEASPLSKMSSVDFRELFRFADAGDAIAQQIVDHCIHVWSVGTVGLIHAYGPEHIVFGGAVMARAEQILPSIIRYVNQHAWTPSGTVSIVPAKLGNYAALHGAVPILREFLQRDNHADNLR